MDATATAETAMTTLTIDLPTHLAEAVNERNISPETLTSFVTQALEKLLFPTEEALYLNGDAPVYPTQNGYSINGQTIEEQLKLGKERGYYTMRPVDEGSALGERAGEAIPGTNGATLKLKDGREIPAAFIIAPGKESPWVRGDLVEYTGERVAGLHAGKGWVSDDFDDPLPDEFWFGGE